MRRMIDVGPGASATHSHLARRRANARVFYESEIDHQSVITNSESAAVMSPASDGKEEIIFSGKVYSKDDIGHIRTTRDQARFLGDHRIVDFASVVVVCVVWFDDGASQICFKFGNGFRFKRLAHRRMNKESTRALFN